MGNYTRVQWSFRKHKPGDKARTPDAIAREPSKSPTRVKQLSTSAKASAKKKVSLAPVSFMKPEET
jgi:hypothetical protein